MSNSRLFEPITIGNLKLSHRLGLAPLTRYRASDAHVPLPMTVDYYSQRSSVPGTLLISEGTLISVEDGGYANVPGIYNDEQIAAWRKVTDAVHAKGGYIFCQIWALGRAANAEFAKTEGTVVAGADTIPIDSASAQPQRLTVEEIQQRVKNFANAAQNAIAAGFDGVELHGANGYLIDQFIQDCSNQRDDEYGGSIENRSRFAIEAVKAVTDAIGPERTGIRLSPWSTFSNMKMADPIPQFSDVIRKLASLNLAYLHLVESRISGNVDVESTEELTFAYDLWNGPLLIAGGFKPESAKELVDKHPDKKIVVIFGRLYISTPDLPFRIKHGIELTKYNRDTFYNAKDPVGYIDYPFSKEYLEGVK